MQKYQWSHEPMCMPIALYNMKVQEHSITVLRECSPCLLGSPKTGANCWKVYNLKCKCLCFASSTDYNRIPTWVWKESRHLLVWSHKCISSKFHSIISTWGWSTPHLAYLKWNGTIKLQKRKKKVAKPISCNSQDWWSCSDSYAIKWKRWHALT